MSVKKLFTAIFCAAVLISLFVFSSSGASSRVVDELGMFDDYELEELNDAISLTEQETGVRFYIVTSEKYYSNDEMAAFCGLDKYDDFCVLLIEDDLTYTLYTYGKANRRVSDSEIDAILDDPAVYDNIKSGRAFDGAMRFLEITPKTLEIPYVTIIIVAVILGSIVALITICIVVSKYKMRMRPTNYPLEQFARLELTHREDHFIGKHVAVVVTSSGSFGGGGGGGGGRSGGGGARGSR